MNFQAGVVNSSPPCGARTAFITMGIPSSATFYMIMKRSESGPRKLHYQLRAKRGPANLSTYQNDVDTRHGTRTSAHTNHTQAQSHTRARAHAQLGTCRLALSQAIWAKILQHCSATSIAWRVGSDTNFFTLPLSVLIITLHSDRD